MKLNCNVSYALLEDFKVFTILYLFFLKGKIIKPLVVDNRCLSRKKCH